MQTLLSLSKKPYSTSTINIGAMVAKALDSQITLFTVIESESSKTQTYDELQLIGKDISNSSDILIRQGNPENEIISETESGKYNLLVIGARTHSSVPTEFIFGDTTHRIVKDSPISVLVSRGITQNLNHILVCTSGPNAGFDALRTAIKMSKHTNSKLTLLHVSRAVPSMYTGLDQMGESLSDLLQTDTPTAQYLRDCAALLNNEKIDAEIELRHGTPTQEILRDIDRNTYDLLIIGASKKSTFNRMLTDNVSAQLAASAPLSVLVIHNSIQQTMTTNEQ